jgi:histidinol-phosphate aminotransferase
MRDREPRAVARLDDPRLAPYVPDAPAAAAARGVGRVARLDANESPAGPFPGVADALAEVLASANRYPDRGLALVEALAARHGVPPEAILVGNGGDALIANLCSAYLDAGDEAVMAAPSFVSYAIDALRVGGRPVEVPVRADGCLDLPAMAAAVTDRTRIAFVCNPNNPTGGQLPDEDVRRFLDEVPADVLIVIDEAYVEYVDDRADAGDPIALDRPNVCRLRTFSKLYGLAGLRVGYLVGPPASIMPVRRMRNWFDVSDAAHVAATVSLGQPDEVARRRAANAEGRRELEGILRAHGLEPLPSAASFLLAPVDDPAPLAARLAERGVLTRVVGAGHLRIAVGDADDRAQLAAALAG